MSVSIYTCLYMLVWQKSVPWVTPGISDLEWPVDWLKSVYWLRAWQGFQVCRYWKHAKTETLSMYLADIFDFIIIKFKCWGLLTVCYKTIYHLHSNKSTPWLIFPTEYLFTNKGSFNLKGEKSTQFILDNTSII